jgi:hypothetical protein
LSRRNRLLPAISIPPIPFPMTWHRVQKESNIAT